MPERIERRGATRKSVATPIGPQGCGGMGPPSSLPLLDDALTSPASQRLEYGPMALATDDTRLSGRASGRQRSPVPQVVRSVRYFDDPPSGCGRLLLPAG